MTTPQYLCVRGFMKSGTNWLGSLLSSHADVSVRGEFHLQRVFLPLWELIQNNRTYRDIGEQVLKDFREFYRRTIRSAAEPSAQVVGDRTPHRLIPEMLPDAKYVSIVRDGRDVVVSRVFHLLNNAHVIQDFRRFPEMRPLWKQFQSDPHYFRRHPEQLLSSEQLVRESSRMWAEHLQSDRKTVESNQDLQVRFIRYEDLHTDVGAERKKLFEFLEVDPTRAAKISGVLEPGFKEENPNRFLRKGAVGDWENYFTPHCRKWFIEEAGEELIRREYVQRNDW